MIQKLRTFDARKSLGQNFLYEGNIARKLLNIFAPSPEDTIIEVGPGFGALTEHLVPSGCHYIGVEIDKRLVAELHQRFSQFENFQLRNCDFLRFDLADACDKEASVRLIGNIPYHITSSIIFKAFDQHHLMKDMMLMMQKEVAQRIVAEHGNKEYGILSVVSKTYAAPKIVATIPPTVFIPRPDVDSAVVHWDFSVKPKRQPVDDDFFRLFVRTIFNQRRKMLRNTLKTLGDVSAFTQSTGHDVQCRPEELSVQAIIDLCNEFYKFSFAKKDTDVL